MNFHGKMDGRSGLCAGCDIWGRDGMLEDMAWRILARSEAQIWMFSFGFLLLGAAAAAVAHRGAAVLNRAPYFALTSVVVMAIAVGQLIWLQTGLALVGGWLWGLCGLEALFSLTAGYALVVLGQARSRDVLGHGRAGILVLVPLANLWLLLAPGREPSLAGPVVAMFRGGIGVVVGLVMILGSRGLQGALGPMIEARVRVIAEDPAHAVRFLEFGLRQGGLDEMLRQIAAEVEVPTDLGDGISLRAVRAAGSVLQFQYEVTDPETELAYGAVDAIASDACADPFLGRLLTAGGRIEYLYRAADADIGTISVTQTDCEV